MKPLILAIALLLASALPASAQDRDNWRSASTEERLERLLQDRRTLERLQPRRTLERHPSSVRRRTHQHLEPQYRRHRSRSVFRRNDRGAVIFQPDRTVILEQRNRDARRDVIQVSPRQPVDPYSNRRTISTGQQRSPRLLHGRTIAPFVAQIFASNRLEGREGPSTVYPVITRFAPGQVVTATQSAGGADGIQWYLVASGQGQYAWVRGNHLVTQAR